MTQSDETKKLLKGLKREAEEERKSLELYRGRCTSHKTELYQVLGFYSVFQGVVFNTVATSSQLTCRTAFLPAVLSLLVFFGAFIAVWFKFTDYEEDKEKFFRSAHTEAYIKAKITIKTRNGDGFDHMVYTEEEFNKAMKKAGGPEIPKLRKFKAAIISFLVLFTATIVTCCFTVRCWNPCPRKC